MNFAGACLKPGGILIVGMPNSVNLRKRLDVAIGRTNYTPARGFYEYSGVWRGHIREYTLKETCEIVHWTGFDLIYKNTYHGLLKGRLNNKLLQMLFKSICAPFPGLRDSLLVAGRKPSDWAPRQPDPDSMQTSLTDSWLKTSSL